MVLYYFGFVQSCAKVIKLRIAHVHCSYHVNRETWQSLTCTVKGIMQALEYRYNSADILSGFPYEKASFWKENWKIENCNFTIDFLKNDPHKLFVTEIFFFVIIQSGSWQEKVYKKTIMQDATLLV
jgi:hypothetical protein